jgi:hypothetical protein
MRERLAAALTGVEPLDGVAEAIPLDDAAVHAATVGQAFHWPDSARSSSSTHHRATPAPATTKAPPRCADGPTAY